MNRPIENLWQQSDITTTPSGNRVYLFDHSSRTYKGGYAVYVGYEETDDNPLNMEQLSPARSQSLVNHSPNGFNWGYSGSGPAQCALGILLDVTDNEDIALRWYQDFKSEVIAHIPTDKKIQMSAEKIHRWLENKGGYSHENESTIRTHT